MSLKLNVLIAADASQLKREAAASQAVVTGFGKSAEAAAVAASAGIAKIEREFGTIAVAAREVDAALAGTAGGVQRFTTSISASAGVSSNVLKETGQAAKLTAQQVQGLGYQINDIGTMLAMGASPFQIMASQAGQVIQVLGDGPRGVKGSLAAIGTAILGLATPVNLAVAGLTAAGAAAIYFATRGGREIKPFNEALTEHKALVQDIAKAYGGAEAAQKAYSQRSVALTAFEQRASELELRLAARNSLREAFGPVNNTGIITGGQRSGEGRDAPRVAAEYRAFEAPLLRLREQMKNGQGDARAFIEEVAKIANLHPANDELQRMASELVKLAGSAADAQKLIESFQVAVDKIPESVRRIAEVRAGARDRLADAAGGLRDLIPDRSPDREKIEKLYTQQVEAAKLLFGNNARAFEGELVRITRDRTKAVEELDRVERDRRAGYELDIRSITARTAAERAEIASTQTLIELRGQNVEESVAQRQAAEAAARIYAEVDASAADTLRRSNEARAGANLTGYAAQQQAIISGYAACLPFASGPFRAKEKR